MFVNVDPKNDYAFKAVYGSPRHTRVLLHLLNAVLEPCGLHVHSVRVLNPLSEIQELDDKKLILDVKAADELGRLYNIEMQMVPAPSFPGRLLYYWSNTYASQLTEGQDYGELRPVISICFLDGILFPESDECHLRFRMLESAVHFPFTDDLDLHLFQLPHFTKSAGELETDLDLWLFVLNNGKGLDLANLPPRLAVAETREALEAWAMLTQDRLQREIYEAREKARRDAADWRSALQQAEKRVQDSFRQGIAEGEAKGEARGLIGQVRLCEELLRHRPRPAAELAALSIEELRDLAETLRAKVSRAHPTDLPE
jgi:predicted transposase/invertase (TIGR01784 family)